MKNEPGSHVSGDHPLDHGSPGTTYTVLGEFPDSTDAGVTWRAQHSRQLLRHECGCRGRRRRRCDGPPAGRRVGRGSTLLGRGGWRRSVSAGRAGIGRRRPRRAWSRSSGGRAASTRADLSDFSPDWDGDGGDELMVGASYVDRGPTTGRTSCSPRERSTDRGRRGSDVARVWIDGLRCGRSSVGRA